VGVVVYPYEGTIYVSQLSKEKQAVRARHRVFVVMFIQINI
jgi:hypothetical protein